MLHPVTLYHRRVSWRRAAALLTGLVLLAAIGLVAGQFTRATALLVLGAGLEGPARAVAGLHERPVVESVSEIATRDGPLRARTYRPDGGHRQSVVLVTGMHPAGIDEPRLVHFARSLAAVGLGVITPEIPRLMAFEVSAAATEAIEDVASWTLDDATFGTTGRVGVAGISFSGGLAIVAAGRPALRDRVAFVLSIGGHGDLLRTLETIGGDALSGTAAATTDVFGLTVVLTAVAHHVVPADQVDAVRDWGRTSLEAAHLTPGTRERLDLFARADRLAAALPEPSAQLVRQVRGGDAAALRPRLAPLVRQLAADPALSPERADPPAAPVYLLHGTADEVIPPDESRRLAAHLESHTRVELLITPVLTHTDVRHTINPGDGWALVRFLANLLRQ
jgi:dienelactone hydrolase